MQNGQAWRRSEKQWHRRIPATRLKVEQDRLKQEQDWTEEELIEHFQRWAQNPKVRDWICGKCLSKEEKEARLREIFGVAPVPAEKHGNGECSQAEMRPNQVGSDGTGTNANQTESNQTLRGY